MAALGLGLPACSRPRPATRPGREPPLIGRKCASLTSSVDWFFAPGAASAAVHEAQRCRFFFIGRGNLAAAAEAVAAAVEMAEISGQSKRTGGLRDARGPATPYIDAERAGPEGAVAGRCAASSRRQQRRPLAASYLRLAMGTKLRSVGRHKSAGDGRSSSSASPPFRFQWAIQPGRRPMANIGVNICTGSHRAVDHARIKIDVRIQLALDEVRVVQGDVFQLLRDLEDRVIDVPFGQQAGRTCV